MVNEREKMNYAQTFVLALISVIGIGCVEGLQEVYELEDTRILGMQANPPEIALTSEGTQVVTVTPFVYLPEGVTITSARWTFCPFAAGGELGYRCFLEECLVELRLKSKMLRTRLCRSAPACINLRDELRIRG